MMFSYIGALFNFVLRFITIPLLSKLCSDKTGGLNDGLPSGLSPVFGMFTWKYTDEYYVGDLLLCFYCNLGVDYGSTVRDPYENIDHAPHQSYPKTEPVITPPGTSSYSFTTSNPPTYQA